MGPCGAGKQVSPVPGHRPSCAPTSLWLTLPGSPANDATVGPERESNPLKATQLGGVWFHSGPYRLARVSQGHDAGASQGWGSPCCSRFPQMLVFGVREASAGWDLHTALAVRLWVSPPPPPCGLLPPRSQKGRHVTGVLCEDAWPLTRPSAVPAQLPRAPLPCSPLRSQERVCLSPRGCDPSPGPLTLSRGRQRPWSSPLGDVCPVCSSVQSLGLPWCAPSPPPGLAL